MTIIHYNYSETELKEILNSMVIIVDTREQKNQHVLEYLRKKKALIKFKGMKTGDYSAMIPKNEEYGISRDMYLNAAIERKNGVDELVQSIKDRSRFENELIRASRHPFTLLVEDLEGYQKILNGKYRSKYEPKALLGSLKTFEVRYGFSTVFISPNATGNYIYHHFHYMARELLKGGLV
ncbi:MULTISPECIES: ERCC4 domain-containing protein [Bacillus]|uniref:ERCC4 domain-containing protein n=1 Tax=Bacillus TaxID=1386 RepID=UPI0013EEA553|nr:MULTISPECIES: ERCC4 domain-containing protein [unclassified Bacillus (in: firmicutes)]KAF6604301.1 ERCC4 domain-containing protein [Bacillus sp. EKM420B]KAF6609128.1 ERCC4 domain-containing protein [Bacillus sp. EKM417B]WGD59849.1 ERCC4 domain-containing protein [Bacillus velezensis]WGD66734.1 ERCC4 domain-containing protein [Bacillus velezensis]